MQELGSLQGSKDTFSEISIETVSVGGSVVVVVFSGGAATPVVLGRMAAVNLGSRLAGGAALKGQGYSTEGLAYDLKRSGIDTLSLGIGMKAGRAIREAYDNMLVGGVLSVYSRQVVNRRFFASTLGTAIEGAADGASGMAISFGLLAASRSETWEEGYSKGMERCLDSCT